MGSSVGSRGRRSASISPALKQTGAVSLDPRTPVLVGVGQISRRPEDADGLTRPLDLMVEAVRVASSDAGVPGLEEKVGLVGVVESLGWRTPDAATIVARELGADGARRILTATGGNGPLSLLHEVCNQISAGKLDSAVITGGEAFYSRRLATKLGTRAPEAPADSEVEDQLLGDPRPGSLPAEIEVGIGLPTQVYPLFSTARAGFLGESPETHRRRCAELWSDFSRVAAGNPHAWVRKEFSADEILTESPTNRPVAYPYTKRMCANIQVDQAAAVVVMSAGAAEAAGVPRYRWVFPTAGADSQDTWFVTERADLHSSPAISDCWAALAGATGLGVNDVAHIDLYSCFPSAVMTAADAIGVSLDRQLTLTGGLGFAGGPGNAYCLHSLAQAVDAVRHHPAPALVTGVGWFLTKHAATLLGPEPPSQWHHASPKTQRGSRSVTLGPGPDLEQEAFTVFYDRDGSALGAVVTALSPKGGRHVLRTADPDCALALISGQQVDLGDGTFS